MSSPCLSLKRLQLGLSTLLLVVEVVGLALWIWAPQRLLPWPVGRWEVIHYGHCKAVNASVFVNVSLHVNPLAHFFSGTISRMMNRQVSRQIIIPLLDFGTSFCLDVKEAIAQ